jgi:hypothetical protein
MGPESESITESHLITFPENIVAGTGNIAHDNESKTILKSEWWWGFAAD